MLNLYSNIQPLLNVLLSHLAPEAGHGSAAAGPRAQPFSGCALGR